jgi:RNA polymerase sigma factor (sigma-70 family)
MAHAQLAAVQQYIRRLVVNGAMTDWTDGQLLRTLATPQREVAFALLLRRHGPMVWGLCRRLLVNWHDAEDAFQATFLILSRRAACIRKRESLASWLYGVAWRVATRAKIVACRRQAREREVSFRIETTSLDESRPEWPPLLHEELNRLPEKYRAPLVLCYLQGKTHATAARELGCPSGSMSNRLARGRELLRQRLTRRGLTLAAGLVSTAAVQNAGATAVPPALVEGTLRTASLALTGEVTSGMGVSAASVALADGVLRAMIIVKLKVAGMVTAACLLTGLGLAVQSPLAALPAEAEELSPAPPAKPPAVEKVDRLAPEALQAGIKGLDVGQHAFEALVAAFSPDGKILAIASGYRDEGGALTLWDLTTGRRRGMRTDRFGLRTVAFSPDGKTVAAAGWDRFVRLFDTASGKERVAFEWQEEAVAAQEPWYNRLVSTVAFSPDGTILAAACGDNQIRLWDVARSQRLRTLSGHGADVKGVAFFPDGKTLASTSPDKTLKFWDVNTGREKASIEAHSGGAEGLAISQDGRTVATSGYGGLVKLWDAATFKERTTLQGHTNGVPAVAFSRDGERLASVSGTWGDLTVIGEVIVWDLATSKQLLTLPTGHTKAAWSVCFSPDGKMLATVSRDETVKLWEVATWGERLTLSLNPRAAAENTLLSSKQFAALWDDLASQDAAKAYRAMQTLVQAGPQAVALAHLRYEQERPHEGLQALRGVEVLEQIGSREARQVLERLAKGLPQSRLAQEAKASLERLALRPPGAP